MAARKKATSRKTGSASDAAAPEPGFEARLEALEDILDALESQDLDLESSLEQFRAGVEHLTRCRALLDRHEAALEELLDAEGARRALRIGEDGLVPDESDPS